MDQLLSTKLFTPSIRVQFVSRPRLVDRLNAGLDRKLSLIAAPAGFGKTSLAVEWASQCGRPVAWLSLDEGDADPVRFLTYLAAALQTISNPAGARLAGLLRSPQPPPLEMILADLVNQTAAAPGDFAIILDDYHRLDSQPVDKALIFLLDNLPSNAHIVVTSREDPQFPLARLRARNQLAEIRAADLRFDLVEAARFLNQVMALDLTEHQVAALEERTEGWIAGLQLAALSMRDHMDADEFIRSFSGSHQFVLDYLVEEVLAHQPENIQAFLLKTSILDRFCGPLCDAVLCDDTVPGQQTLERLVHTNLFLTPLDNERRWFRYHHLFADLLQQRLRKGSLPSVDVSDLHIRASRWYENEGQPVEAFQHAVAGNDLPRAERLVAGGGMPLQYRGAIGLVLRWLESLSMTDLDARPSLWVTFASTLTMVGRPVEDVEAILHKAETALQNAPSNEGTRDLVGHIAAIRAMLAIPQDKVETIVTQSRRALEYLAEDNLSVRTTAAWTLGLAYQRRGERAESIQAFKQALANSLATGNTMISIASATSLGQQYELENRLQTAKDCYQQVLGLAGKPPLPAACEAHVGLGRIACELNDLETAEAHCEMSRMLAAQIGNVDTPASCDLLEARIRFAKGDTDGALATLSRAERFVKENHFLHRLPAIAAAQVRGLIRKGSPAAAERLARSHGDPLSLAAVLLAQENAEEALTVLEPVHKQAEKTGWADELLSVHILTALAYRLLGRREQAAAIFDKALALSAPSGMIRIFADEGPAIGDLVRQASAAGTLPAYTAKLFEALGLLEQGAGAAAGQALPEALSARELEILRLVALGLSNRQIADRLFLSLNTIKGYNRTIFQKLQVQRRTEAVARAQALNLL